MSTASGTHHGIPDFFGSQNHCWHILAAHESLTDQIFRCLLYPVQIIRTACVALANGETSVSASFPLIPRERKGFECTDQSGQVPQGAQLRDRHIPARV